MTSDAPEQADFSRAFETFVDADDDAEDVIGLLAYALFKQSIREDCIGGSPVGNDRRNPSATTVRTYRGAAEQILSGVIDRAIDQATPDIQESAVLTELGSMETRVKAHVDRRTHFGWSLAANVIAWIITLALGLLIFFANTRPNAEDTLRDAVDGQEAVAIPTTQPT